jgi:PAS domain S-box-containing protein
MQSNSSKTGLKQHWYSLDLKSELKIPVWISIITVFVISLLDLAGWKFNITLFKSIIPQWIPMKIITAVYFILAATSLLIIKLDFPAILRKILSRVLAVLLCIGSLITIYVYLYSLIKGHEPSFAGIPYPWFFLPPGLRMSFLTAGNFFLLGCILLFLAANNIKASNIAHALVIPLILISYYVLISYILGVYSSKEMFEVSIGLNTAIAFFGISVAVLLIRPDTWLLRVFLSADTGGIFARKLLPGLMILPLIIGWFRIKGERLELFKSEEGVVLVAITYTVCFLILVLLTARSVNRTDQKRQVMEKALRESEERFRTIAESLPVLISIYSSKDSKFSFVNESYEKVFGFKKGELIDKNILDFLYNPEDRLSLDNTLKEKGRVYNKELRVKKTDGTPFWIMTSIRKIMFMNEVAYLIASIDITETKKVQEELLQLNRTLNAHSKSSQAMMHSNYEFKYINEVCKIIIEDCGHSMVWIGYAQNNKLKTVKPVAYYGFDKGYIDHLNITWDHTEKGKGPTGTAIRTGKPSMCRNMLTDPAFKPWRAAAIERGYASSIVLPLLSDGKSFGAISIYSKKTDPFSESEIKLLTALADDLAYGITYLRLAESEREAMRVIKESENKLKDLIATKDKFFNIVAHDLKNPFTSLLGSSELLYDNIDQMSRENICDLALILNDSAKGGYAILQNLLDWSRSETGLLKFNPESLNLRIVVNESLENVQLQVANKGISAISELNEDFFIFTDKNMIDTVLRNLISNAVKYTYKKGTVVVRAKRNTKECIITVKDSGIGIEKEKVETLFRLENSLSLPGTEKEQGTGLGLKLCKEFTERMGGRIWVESKEGKGSEFNFTIPVKE